MSISTITVRASGLNGAASTTDDTASISPSVGGAVLLGIRYDARTTVSVANVADGLTGTWERVGTASAGGDTFMALTWFKCDALTGTGAIRITKAAEYAGTAWIVYDTSATSVVGLLDGAAAVKTSDTTTFSVDTSAMGSSSGALCIFGSRGANITSHTPHTGWTEGADLTNTLNTSFHAQHRLTSDTSCVTTTSGGTAAAILGMGLELAEAAAPVGATVSRRIVAVVGI